MTAYVGIDLGTQSVRTVVLAEDGELLGSGTAPLTSRRDGPRHEQDPEQWWAAVGEACRAALADLDTSRIAGAAVDATSGTVLLTDHNGDPLTAGIMYDDTRATSEAVAVNEVGAAVWARLGYQRMQPSWALPKLRWLVANTPLPGGARVAHQGDFINARLVGGRVPSDFSTALKSGCDLIGGGWPLAELDQLGIPSALLPSLVLPGTEIGQVGVKAAELTGLPAGVPVLAGMTDGCAGQISSGALTIGSWNSVLGTTLVLKGVTADLVGDPAGAVYSHRSPDGNWLPGGASSTGAGALTRQLPGRDLDALSARADRYEPSGALAYPLASDRGERFPFVAPDATGFVLGEPADDGDLYAALIQGVSYVERLCFDYLNLLGARTDGRLVMSGGAVRSRYWCQLRADILDRPVSLVDSAGSAAGMAILAAYGVYGARAGRTAGQTAAELVRVTETIDPRPGRARRFADRYHELVGRFEERGWIAADLAHHARERLS